MLPSSGNNNVAGDRGAGKRGRSGQEDKASSLNANEPLYCFCQRVSFGDMVGCDNDECPYEWFHFECVNLVKEPTESWFCSECTAKEKSRKKRKRA